MATQETDVRFPIFRERFCTLRGDMTQDEFAKKLGFSRPTVGLYESGSRVPDALALRTIAEKCDVSADWLVGLSDIKSRDAELQTVCNYTGLSEASICNLLRVKYETLLFYKGFDNPLDKIISLHGYALSSKIQAMRFSFHCLKLMLPKLNAARDATDLSQLPDNYEQAINDFELSKFKLTELWTTILKDFFDFDEYLGLYKDVLSRLELFTKLKELSSVVKIDTVIEDIKEISSCDPKKIKEFYEAKLEKDRNGEICGYPPAER